MLIFSTNIVGLCYGLNCAPPKIHRGPNPQCDYLKIGPLGGNQGLNEVITGS